ncbi:ferrous iron transport protein A [Roseospira marina]|uniref:Ferrous iron transport protein A n=1 Tax=Roseospira marina TaxID=140057 RepID=A0A5M6IFK5_9PROT|nr:FeoA family protein [Roseospira marina]KAA5606529.1 ferrous iron transport protein A [Roseospira marina]MBB4314043.1 Fe2+ transport system protein FeoA [Roseospira marina]MBB5087204.1 Fe2+ transport system protein FeoA [Roseospira marina]
MTDRPDDTPAPSEDSWSGPVTPGETGRRARRGWGWRDRLRGGFGPRAGGHGHGLGAGRGRGPGPHFAGASLGDIAPGGDCQIVALHGRGAIRQRLMDLGLVPNMSVTVVRRAPLGDPIQVRADETFITLRRAEASRVEVVPA